MVTLLHIDPTIGIRVLGFIQPKFLITFREIERDRESHQKSIVGRKNAASVHQQEQPIEDRLFHRSQAENAASVAIKNNR